MKQSNHERRKSFSKFGMTGQHSGDPTIHQLKQSKSDKQRLAQQDRFKGFAAAASGSNIPFLPRTCSSSALFRPNKYGPRVGSKAKILWNRGTLVIHRAGVRGKSARRVAIRERRLDRELAAQNAATMPTSGTFGNFSATKAF